MKNELSVSGDYCVTREWDVKDWAREWPYLSSGVPGINGEDLSLTLKSNF